MDELEQLRLRRMAQLQQQQNAAINEENMLQQQIEQIESVVKQKMSKEALQRYGNIKSAHPEKALTLLAIIGKGIENGQIKSVEDKLLKLILLKMQDGKKEIKIRKI
jgi:programmed cell death protein 5